MFKATRAHSCLIVPALLLSACGAKSNFSMQAPSSSSTAPTSSSHQAVVSSPIASSVGVQVSQAQDFHDAKSPCLAFRLACLAGGFTLSNGTPGNRLIADCISILVTGKSATSSSGQLVPPPAGSDATACAANIHRSPGDPTTGMHSIPGASSSPTPSAVRIQRIAQGKISR